MRKPAKKTKVVKAKVKVTKPAAKARKRLSKGVCLPWEVWAVEVEDNSMVENPGEHKFEFEFKTQKEAEKFIKNDPNLFAPVIVHVIIPPMEY